jgi:hypothetical protein
MEAFGEPREPVRIADMVFPSAHRGAQTVTIRLDGYEDDFTGVGNHHGRRNVGSVRFGAFEPGRGSLGIGL